MTLGQRIKKLRTEKGLTQKDLADQLHVTFQTISKWENDENEPDIATLKLLTKIFDCSLDELLDNEKETESNIEEQPSIQNPKRKTYVSDNPLNVNSLAFCTSFELISGIYTYSDKMVSNSSAEYKKEISEKQYSFTRKMMKDVLADFFIDDANKTFGFYYEHAEQFVCPFENVLDINIEEGNYICGIERVKSYLIKISYCSDDVVDTYSVLLFAYTQASKEKWRLVNDSLLLQESDSQTWVNNTLSVIKDKISLIKQIGNDIKANKIQVNPFDIDEKNAVAKEGQRIMNVAHSLVKKHREKEIKQQPWSTNAPSASRPANTQNTVRRVYYDNEGSTVGGFCLGFFLGLLGLIIALITKEDKTKSGAIAGFIVYILIAVVVGTISYFVLRTHNY